MYRPAITLTEIIDEKISLLYDFRILKHKKGMRCDSRENAVRKMLRACGNENRMEAAIRGIHTGDYTLNQLLEMKGFAI